MSDETRGGMATSSCGPLPTAVGGVASSPLRFQQEATLKRRRKANPESARRRCTTTAYTRYWAADSPGSWNGTEVSSKHVHRPPPPLPTPTHFMTATIPLRFLDHQA